MASNSDSSRKDNKIQGKYANYFAVGHNAYEFIFDFGQNYSENDQAELYTSIVTNPTHAKTLFELIHRSIAEYEQTHVLIENDADEHQGRLNLSDMSIIVHYKHILIQTNPAGSFPTKT